MRGISFLLFAVASATALGGGCGGDETDAATTGDGAKSCAREADCDDQNGCTYDFCISGICDYTVVNSGPDEEADQVDGDCMVIACDAGEQVTIADDDPPDDPNEEDCSLPVCEEGVATEAPREAGDFCSNNAGPGVCDAAGTCSCTPPSPEATVFVDPVEGTDDSSHGGAWGSCAYRTLDYALSQAQGMIVVPNIVFTSAEVTYPIVLTGEQGLRCDHDDNEGTFTIFSGSGTYGAGSATIAFEGTRNRLEDCGVDGGGTATFGIVVASIAADADIPHEIRAADVTGTTSVAVLVEGSGLYLADSAIHDNAGAGLAFTPADPHAYLENNTFSGNGTDVSCSAASPAVEGGGNSLATCEVCDGCPF